MAAVRNLLLVQGEDFHEVFSIRLDNQAINLTGYVFEGDCRAEQSHHPLFFFRSRLPSSITDMRLAWMFLGKTSRTFHWVRHSTTAKANSGTTFSKRNLMGLGRSSKKEDCRSIQQSLRFQRHEYRLRSRQLLHRVCERHWSSRGTRSSGFRC
jgi:hypothetical protein